MVLKGLKFGMILQLAVGPMCIMVLNTAVDFGILSGMSLVLAIVLIDALYITLSGLGASAIIAKDKVKIAVKIIGCIILVFFGLNTILNVFDINILPNISMFSDYKSGNLFLQGIILTASNPLTIIFWGGVFTTQIADNNLTRFQLFLFGAGCVLSTLIFLSGIALFGYFIGSFIPGIVIKILNILVGAFLIFFGIKLLVKKNKAEV